MKTHLKIKIVTLAAEAKIIRREEKKWRKPSFKQYKKDVRAALKAGGWPAPVIHNTSFASTDDDMSVFPDFVKDAMPNPKHYNKPSTPPHPMWHSLNGHRRGVVRSEARHSLLAYGFLRGRPYRVIENKCHEAPDWHRVEDLAVRFGLTDGTVSLKTLLKTPSPWDVSRQQIKQRLEQWVQEGTNKEEIKGEIGKEIVG